MRINNDNKFLYIFHNNFIYNTQKINESNEHIKFHELSKA
jgi:hypothetical protein